MNTYKRLFDTLINNFKDNARDGLDELINFIEKTGNDALDYIESLDVDTLNELKGEANFNKIYEQFFSSNKGESFSNNDEWFKEKEKRYRQDREKRRKARENRRYNNSNKRQYSSSEHSSYNENDPYKIFGIPRNSTWKIIRLTYVKLVKKYHPDTRNSNMSPREKKIADIKLQKIYKAWEYFNENKRKFK